jgi:hypothetical protein
MQGELGRWLTSWGLSSHYQRRVRLGDDMFHLTLPFVHLENGLAIKAVKPLDLDRKEPTAVFEHGDLWVQRVRRLAERHHVPQRMIFTVRLPERGTARTAADDVIADLKRLPQVDWIPFGEGEQLRYALSV